MIDQERLETGRFAPKGDLNRVVRSIRLTNNTWLALRDKAIDQGMSRADFLEELFAGGIDWEENEELETNNLDFDSEEVAEILKNALALKERGNKHLKTAIKEVLELLGEELEDDE